MIPLWIFIPVAVLAVLGCFGWLRALIRAQETVDHILDWELDHPWVKPSAASDEEEARDGND